MHLKKEKKIFYFRSSSGEEIDLIEENKEIKNFIEIKSSASFKPLMIETLENYLENEDKGYLVYQGEDFPYTKNIKILNYENYLKKTDF